MSYLILGILLWAAVHLFKRVVPTGRAAMAATLPKGADRGVIAILLFISLALIVVGYRQAEFEPVYDPLPGAGHLNNLLMYVTVVLFGMGSSKGRMRSWLRHPMLTGVMVWGAAHLLVNGDLASLVLFGSMIAWAIVEILIINTREPVWERPEPGPIARDVVLLVMAAVLFAIIAAIHIWLGRNPFLGNY